MSVQSWMRQQPTPEQLALKQKYDEASEQYRATPNGATADVHCAAARALQASGYPGFEWEPRA